VLRALLVGLLSAAACGAPHAQELRAGFGSAVLPAPEGGPLAGYGGIFERRASGVLDAPEVRVLLLERGELRVAIAAFDLLLIRPEIGAALRLADAARDVDGLVLVATHTHSGPGGYVPGWLAGRVTGARYDAAVAPRLAGAGAAALAAAIADLRPARIGALRAELDLAENRRNPNGRRETAFEVIRIDVAGAQPITALVYGAHPTLLSARNRALSADYPGALRRWLGARGWRALFAQGPLGDQQPDPRLAPAAAQPSDVEIGHVEAVGAALGSAALRALAGIETRSDAALAFAQRETAAPVPRPRRGCALWWLAPLSRPALRRLASPRVPVQALRLGPARLLFVPAEPSAEVGVALRSANPGGQVAIVALANDWIGYLVSPGEYAGGGYEACMSFAGARGADWLVGEAAQTLALLDVAP
jgi:hypothetical protein